MDTINTRTKNDGQYTHYYLSRTIEHKREKTKGYSKQSGDKILLA